MTAAIPNNYTKVSTPLLGALKHVERLHAVSVA
jgi:hypothetical protein